MISKVFKMRYSHLQCRYELQIFVVAVAVVKAAITRVTAAAAVILVVSLL